MFVSGLYFQSKSHTANFFLLGFSFFPNQPRTCCRTITKAPRCTNRLFSQLTPKFRPEAGVHFAKCRVKNIGNFIPGLPRSLKIWILQVKAGTGQCVISSFSGLSSSHSECGLLITNGRRLAVGDKNVLEAMCPLDCRNQRVGWWPPCLIRACFFWKTHYKRL